MPKARLIEKIAELVNERKLPLVEDVRDESAEDVRVVIVPKSRNVDPALMMEALFKLSELESRIPLNMNVLSRGAGAERHRPASGAARVAGSPGARCWSAARNHRLAEIVRRLELLDGFIIAYLNLDEVIRIIREEDEPKQELIKAFALTETQAEAILNMRLRNLRKLEEMEIRRSTRALRREGRHRGSPEVRFQAVEGGSRGDRQGPQEVWPGRTSVAAAPASARPPPLAPRTFSRR